MWKDAGTRDGVERFLGWSGPLLAVRLGDSRPSVRTLAFLGTRVRLAVVLSRVASGRQPVFNLIARALRPSALAANAK